MANLKDTIIAGVLRVTGTIYGNLIGKVDGKTVASKVEYIVGTQTASTGTWTGVTTDTELYDGKEIIYVLPYAGSGNATLNLTLAGGTTTGAKNVYAWGTTRFTTHFGVNTPFRLTYHKSITINGTAYEGWWHHGDYNTNTNNAVAQTATTTNANYEVLFSVTADNTTRTEGARKNNNLLFNPSTGNLQATQLNGVTIGSSPKFTDTNTTYTANTVKLVTTTVPNVTNKGTVPSLTITSTACDDITAWTTNTPTTPLTASASEGVLTLTAGSTGTAASLSYTARSVGSASGWSAGTTPTLGTAITVATGSTSASGTGATVATGITAS